MELKTRTSWHEHLLAEAVLRTGSPFAREEGEILTLAAGMEFLDAIPQATRQMALMDLVSHFTVGDDVQMVAALIEVGEPEAAVVPEAAVKPIMAGTVGGENVRLETFAALLEVGRHWLADRRYLESLLREEMRDALAHAMWLALLAAAAADPDIPSVSGDIRDGETEVEEQGYLPDAVAINPRDWQAIEDAHPARGTMVGQYRPGLMLPMYGPLWVLPTPAMPQGTALVGDFRGLGLITQRTASFSLSYSDQDDFVRNRAKLRLEQMGAAIVCAPKRLCRVTLG